MSRGREEKRKKRDELARQLGVKRADVEEHQDLATRERVTRPVVQLVERTRSGVLGKLFKKEGALACALFLVEAKGARLLDAHALDGAKREVGKVVYHRPAHFVVVVAPVDASALTTSLRIDGLALADKALAEWEQPRRCRVDQSAGAVVSIRGVARVDQRYAMPLDGETVTLHVEV